MLAFGQHNLGLCGGLWPQFGALWPSFVDLNPFKKVGRGRQAEISKKILNNHEIPEKSSKCRNYPEKPNNPKKSQKLRKRGGGAQTDRQTDIL